MIKRCFLPLIFFLFTLNAFSEDAGAIDKKIALMSTREKIGQCCLMNFRFFTNAHFDKTFADALTIESPEKFTAVNRINSTIYKTVKDYHIGAVILFTENMTDSAASKNFIRDLNQAALAGDNTPLLFCADQEGGNVNRIYDFKMPSAMAIRKCGNLENAFLSGQANGALLREYGILVDFAPDCDISSNKANPVIGIRSFSDDKNYAAQYSNAMRKGLAQSGVIACAKHFPGHGDTSTDSHIGLPTIKRSYSKWKQNEAVPFIKNIDEGIPMIMTAHIQMPKIDSKKIYGSKSGKKIYTPATLSHKILTEILRKKLGFNGVIVTDAMDMKAISDNFTPSESFILALKAGVNLVCHPINVYSTEDLKFMEQFFTEVEDAVKTGFLPEEVLNDSVRRILLLKESAGVVKIQGERIISAPQSFIPMTWKQKEDAAILSKKIQQLATRNTYKNRISIKKDSSLFVLVPDSDKGEWVQNYLESRADLSAKNAEIFSYNEITEIDGSLSEKILSRDKCIIFTQLNGYAVNNKANWRSAFPKLLSEIFRKNGRTGDCVCISTNLPYDDECFIEKGLGWCATFGYSSKEYRAGLDIIFPSID